MLLWDGPRSTKATLVVKVKVEELRVVPSSIVVGESDDFYSEPWTMPVVILQQEILGGGPPNEDTNPVDGIPHPLPLNTNFHPNQINDFLGPIQQHQAQDVDHLTDFNAPAQNDD